MKASARETRPTESTGAVRGLAQRPPHEPLEGAVEAVGDPADLPTQVTDQPDALRRDRRPDLGRLGDALDQLLDLLRSEQPIPGMVDDVGIERPCCGPFDRRAGERPLERLLGRFGLEHAKDRALDRGALERPHDRLLGRGLDGAIDPGRGGDPFAGASADPEYSRRQGRAPRCPFRA